MAAPHVLVDDETIRRISAGVAAQLMVVVRPDTLTWVQLWTAYEPREVPKLESPAVQRSMGKHLCRLLGPEPVAGLTTERVFQYRQQRKAEVTHRGRPPGDKTINNEVILIRRLTRWAANQRPPLIERDPIAGVPEADLMVPVNNVRLNVVDDRPGASLSLLQFLSRADLFERALVLVAHSSGMRRRELALLELDWIDRDLRVVTIPPGIAKGRRGQKPGRMTIVSAAALRALDEYRATLPRWCDGARWAFVNERSSKPYGPDFFTRRFRKLERRVGVEGPSGPTWLHDLRRSFVTLARRRGEDAIRVMKLAGHATLESQQRYHIESLEEVLLSRDRIETARADATRRGPVRAPPPEIDDVGEEASDNAKSGNA
jgi:integrase